MYILSAGTFIERLFRNIFFLIDDAIYSQIPKLYDLLLAIAKTSPLSQASIADMASRIYKLLAVFMMFKVIFSLIMYVVNPDDFSDKTKGVSKLVTNIVISLALLVLTPYFFSYGYQFQKIILEDNALATIIFGEETDVNNTNIINAGDQMAYLAISAFVYPNTNLFHGCTNIANMGTDGTTILEKECFGFEDVNLFAPGGETKFDTSQCDSNGKTLCSESLKPSKDGDNKSELTKADLANYAAGIQYQNYNLFFRKDLITDRVWVDGDPDYFAIKYVFLISTIVGVIIALFLITSCLDIALRSIKLAFLQLIAPIPILSYIDPKSGKDGMFKKWYQMCLKTYLSLFLKLLALYFALYIISRVGRLVDIIDGSHVTNAYVTIFIIIGALMFAKNFTKILESLGVKLDGGFQLNPFKKLENEALGMKKPAAFANKLAKGVLTSPATGASLVGKKMMAGFDAKKNGQGFGNGWKSVPISSKFAKKWDELHPYSAEAKKNKAKGEASLHKKDMMYKEGEKLYNKYGSNISDAFKNQEYKDSYKAVDDAKKNMFAWQHAVEDRRAELNGAYARGADANEIAEKKKALDKALTQSGKAQSVYELTKSKHDDVKLKYSQDALLEDQHDFYVKYSGKSADQFNASTNSTISPDTPVHRNEHKNNEHTSAEHTTTDNTTSNNFKSDSTTEESSNPTSSTNTENVENNSFEPIYRDLDEQLQAAYEEYAQYDDISGTADDAAKREEIEKQIKDLHNKKIDDKIRILQAELVQYDGIAMTPEDIKKQNEILEEIAKLQRQKR